MWKPVAKLVAQGGSLLQRGILERERRMEPEEGGDGSGGHPACRRAGHPARRIGSEHACCAGSFERPSGRQDAALYGRQDARRYSVWLLASADERHVLLQALAGDARAVAVGELIAKAGAQAGLSDCLLDGREEPRTACGLA